MRTATKAQIEQLILYIKSGTTCTSFVIHDLSGTITAHVYPNRMYNPARYKLNVQLAVVYNLPAQVAHTLITLYPNNCRVCAKL